MRLQDIADACGVSRNTVSIALRDGGSLRADTIERIRNKAEELGYVPDPELSKLMTRLRERDKEQIQAEVAYVYFNAPVQERVPHWPALKAASELLERKGYRMNCYYQDDLRGKREEEIARVLEARGVEGVILGAMRGGQNSVKLNWDQHSVVALGRVLVDPVVPQVDADTYQAMRSCYRYLYGQGCRRIGMMLRTGYDVQIRNSYRAAFLMESSLHLEESLAPILNWDLPEWREPDAEEFLRWRDQHNLDALIGFDTDAIWLRELGLSIPGDLNFAAMHISPKHNAGVPGIVDDWRIIGESLAEQLIYAIQHGIRGGRASSTLTLVEGRWSETG